MLKRKGKLSEVLLGPDYNIEFFKAFYENHTLVMRLSKLVVMAEALPYPIPVNFRMIL